MNKILVPIDGSDSSFRAIDTAKELAKVFNSRLVLLHVEEEVPTPIAGTIMTTGTSVLAPGTGTLSGPTAAVPIGRPAGERDVESLSAAVLERGQAHCTVLGDRVTTVAMFGNPADLILDYVAHNDVDLVVMGAHGFGGVKRHGLGSVVARVAGGIGVRILIDR